MKTYELGVCLCDPRDGLIDVRITSPGRCISFAASSSPCDSLHKLAQCLILALLGIERAMTFHTESAEYDLRFRPDPEHRLLALRLARFPDARRHQRDAECLLDLELPGRQISMTFLDALRDLGGRLSPEELAARWGRQFPGPSVNRLARLVETFQSAAQPA